ncbi:MAG: T9SS type A sorting domain-containing protein [Porphyromonadaceae bacterium]|nr:T9SS type A sorting domain-containing protein [Porphyromonadaceae bacterium]
MVHLRLPELCEQDLPQETSREQAFRVLRFAVSRDLNLSPESCGEWLIDDRGCYTWRCTITSPNAKGIGLTLRQYHLPKDAALYIYGADRLRRGAFTDANNNPDGLLSLAPVQGEQITLEYECPPRGARIVPFVIDKLHHDFLGMRAQAIRSAIAGEPIFDHNRNALPKLDCARNVVAFPEWNRQSRATLLQVVNGGLYSTGTLINNLRGDGTAYVLTAAHNVNRLYELDDIEAIKQEAKTTVFFFGFQSQKTNGNIRGTEEMTLSGAELVAYNPEADMALLRITGLPKDVDGNLLPIPTAYNACFAGWSISPTPPHPYVGIHHPLATTKRYNQTTDEPIAIEDNYSIGIGLSWDEKHWYIPRWEIGTTAGGSSGSGLFDRNGLLIGALTGGASTCTSPESDHYYAIHRTWVERTDSMSLRPFLDPDNTGKTLCEGYDPHVSNAVYRLSDFPPNSPKQDDIQVLSDEKLRGIGRVINLKEGEVTPLGVYLLFRGEEHLKTSFPQMDIKLRELADGKTLGRIVWETELNAATFDRYDRQENRFGSSDRTLDADTIELFVPSLSDLQPSAIGRGSYMLTLTPKSASEFIRFPFLYQAKRKTATSWNMFELDQTGWTPRNGDLWVDLLVQSPTSPNVLPIPSPALHGAEIQCYYYQSRLYVLLPKRFASAQLRLYSLSGQLVHQQKLSSATEYVVPVDFLVTGGVYVVQIEAEGEKRTLKFIYQ